MTKALTTIAVEKLKAGSVRREVPDRLLTGLYLVIQPSGKKSWAVRYRAGKRTRKFTLGAYPVVDLAKARELAKAALMTVQTGGDPSVQKRVALAESAAITVEDAAKDFVQRYCRRRKSLMARSVARPWPPARAQ